MIEVDRTEPAGRRGHGKSDPVDAIEAARAALSGRASGIAKTADGNVEAIRALLVAQRSGREARARCLNQIRHLGFTSPDHCANSSVTCPKPASPPRRRPASRIDGDPVLHATKLAMRTLGRRALAISDDMHELEVVLGELVAATAPALLACHGVGIDTAAMLLVAAGDNPERIRNEAAWAHLCGVAPLEASSGKQRRHRLSPRRQPSSEPCAVADRVHPHGQRPTHPRLRRAAQRRRTLEARDHPRPEALRRPRNLPAATRTMTKFWGGGLAQELPDTHGLSFDRYADRYPNPHHPTPHGLIRARPHPSGPSLVCQQRRKPLDNT